MFRHRLCLASRQPASAVPNATDNLHSGGQDSNLASPSVANKYFFFAQLNAPSLPQVPAEQSCQPRRRGHDQGLSFHGYQVLLPKLRQRS
jgi:hypothetical protein